jgi:Tol biopolymer transport system component
MEIDVWPIVSPDGKYLFYTSRKDGIQDIYWVNTSFIEELKPEELKLKRK